MLPAPLFRYEFKVKEPIQKAELNICGLGYYEVLIDGEKVGDHVLDPMVTQYDKRARYVSYDVSDRLTVGKHVIGVVLGNGWYNCHTSDVWHFDKATWRAYPKLLLDLEMTNGTDDSPVHLVSSPDWQVSEGPIRFDGLRNGETYDARCEYPGWDTPGFDASDWPQAAIVPGPGGLLEKQTTPPCKVMETHPAVAITEPKPGLAVYDFGLNMAGWVRINISGRAGQEIVLRYSDSLKEDGTVNMEEVGRFIMSGDAQTDRYILKGGGPEIWEPRFTYHGFQYVQVEGLEQTPQLDMVEARVVHTAFDSAGSFSCSNSDLNQLQTCTRRSYVSNFVGIPTDCPHREKNGWTGDAQLAIETGLLNYDSASAYGPWLTTLSDAQRPRGQLPGIAPTAGWAYNWGSGPARHAALVLIPGYIHLYTGDDSSIRTHYDAISRYMDFCRTMASDHIISFGLGDWCAPDPTRMTPAALTSTAYYYAFAKRMEAYAGLMQKNEDETGYRDLAEDIKSAFNRTFYKGQGVYAHGEGTAQACALYQGVVEPDEREAVVQRLVEAVHQSGVVSDFGILGAQYIPRALADNGHADLAYRLFTQPKEPGWVAWLRQGATTLWENWNGAESHNHIMFGDISAWMYHYLAGIRPDPAQPGFRNVLLNPHFLADLDWVKATHHSPNGPISVSWKRKGDTVVLDLALPQGTTATFNENMLQAGTHQFEIPTGDY